MSEGGRPSSVSGSPGSTRRGRTAGSPLHPGWCANARAVARRTKGQAPTVCCLKNRRRGAGASRVHQLGHARTLADIADVHREAGLQEHTPASAGCARQYRMNLLVRTWSHKVPSEGARGPIVAQTPPTTTDATKRSTASRPEKALQ